VSNAEVSNKYTESVISMVTHLLDNMVIPHTLGFFDLDTDRAAYVGSVEVEGKLYALSFTQKSRTEVEVTVTRNANVIKWTYHKDMFVKTLTVGHHPAPGACGHAAYLNDPWLLMRIYTTYIDLVIQRGY
jgi:hypothetical protein